MNKYNKDEFTFIDDVNVYVCNNCGAFAEDIDMLVHYSNCKPGEGKYWEEYYKDNEQEEDI